MAQSQNNLLTAGLSGNINGLVFRQLHGKTVVSKAPHRTVPLSADQQKTVDNFRQAVVYANKVLADEATLQVYAGKARPGQSPNNIAIADFFHRPVIGEIEVNRTPVPGTIKMMVTDDFKVAGVHVRIEHAEGTIIEEGDGMIGEDEVTWTYVITQPALLAAGNIITVVAVDMPGHETIRQRIL